MKKRKKVNLECHDFLPTSNNKIEEIKLLVYLTAWNRILCPVKKISLCPRVGICKCVYKHSLLGELNVTLEIVFSNQVYVATAVDSVYDVCISPIYIRASSWPR